MNNGKITIAWVSSRYAGKGPPMVDALLGLDSEKFRKISIYLKKDSDEPNFLEKSGIKTFYLSGKKYFRIFNFCAVRKLAKILRDEKVDIIHSQRHQATVYATLAAKLAKTPVIFGHVHGLNRSAKPRRKFINALISKKISRLLTAGGVVRQDVIKQFPGIREEQVISIDNSIDVSHFCDVELTKAAARENAGLCEDELVFGTVGRFAPTKGYTYLVDAFAAVKKRLPAAQLVFVGDGRCENEIKEQVKKCGIEGSVHFLGRRNDVPELLRAMDIFVFPSIAEGMPYAVLEAMAAGVPIIASAVGAIPDVLDKGRLGRLVEVRSVEGLAEAMVEIAEMGEVELSRMVKEAKDKAKSRYNHDKAIKTLQNLYESVYNSTCQKQAVAN